MKSSPFATRLKATFGGVIAPVDYSSRTTYRRPPALCRHLQWLAPTLEEIRPIAEHYPVFEIVSAEPGADDAP
jgi:hypothetical protein